MAGALSSPLLLACGLRRRHGPAAQATTSTSPATLWPNGTSAQPLPEGVVAQGDLDRATTPRTPPPVTAELLQHGQERYGSTARPARPGRRGRRHDRAARLPGPARPTTSRGCARRRRSIFFDVITNGYGVMYSYAGAGGAARPLGDRRLYPGAAALPRRGAGRGAGRTGEPAVMAPPLLWLRAQPAGGRAGHARGACCCWPGGAGAAPASPAGWLDRLPVLARDRRGRADAAGHPCPDRRALGPGGAGRRWRPRRPRCPSSGCSACRCCSTPPRSGPGWPTPP